MVVDEAGQPETDVLLVPPPAEHPPPGGERGGLGESGNRREHEDVP